jgi:hypothetical protein
MGQGIVCVCVQVCVVMVMRGGEIAQIAAGRAAGNGTSTVH